MVTSPLPFLGLRIRRRCAPLWREVSRPVSHSRPMKRSIARFGRASPASGQQDQHHVDIRMRKQLAAAIAADCDEQGHDAGGNRRLRPRLRARCGRPGAPGRSSSLPCRGPGAKTRAVAVRAATGVSSSRARIQRPQPVAMSASTVRGRPGVGADAKARALCSYVRDRRRRGRAGRSRQHLEAGLSVTRTVCSHCADRL